MDSIYNAIKNRIEHFEPGTVFLTGEFSDVAKNATIRKTLGRLCETGLIRRVLDGVYEKPKYSRLLKEYIPTDPDAAAHAIARYYHWNIAPSGNVALNMLKLSTQVPVVWTYVSDGPYRNYSSDNFKISFKHRTNRDISGMSPITTLVIEAFKTLGKAYVDDSIISKLKSELSPQDKKTILSESSNSYEWINNVIQEVCST